MRRTWKTWMRLRRLVRPEVTVAMGSRRIRIDLRDGDQVDVIVCRNAALLEEVLGRWHGGRLGP